MKIYWIPAKEVWKIPENSSFHKFLFILFLSLWLMKTQKGKGKGIIIIITNPSINVVGFPNGLAMLECSLFLLPRFNSSPNDLNSKKIGSQTLLFPPGRIRLLYLRFNVRGFHYTAKINPVKSNIVPDQIMSVSKICHIFFIQPHSLP